MYIINYYKDEIVKAFHNKENATKELLIHYFEEILPSYIEDARNGEMKNQTVEEAYQDVYEDLNGILTGDNIPYCAEMYYIEDFSDNDKDLKNF